MERERASKPEVRATPGSEELARDEVADRPGLDPPVHALLKEFSPSTRGPAPGPFSVADVRAADRGRARPTMHSSHAGSSRAGHGPSRRRRIPATVYRPRPDPYQRCALPRRRVSSRVCLSASEMLLPCTAPPDLQFPRKSQPAVAAGTCYRRAARRSIDARPSAAGVGQAWRGFVLAPRADHCVQPNRRPPPRGTCGPRVTYREFAPHLRDHDDFLSGYLRCLLPACTWVSTPCSVGGGRHRHAAE
jgi:hypothetical protein